MAFASHMVHRLTRNFSGTIIHWFICSARVIVNAIHCGACGTCVSHMNMCNVECEALVRLLLHGICRKTDVLLSVGHDQAHVYGMVKVVTPTYKIVWTAEIWCGSR